MIPHVMLADDALRIHQEQRRVIADAPVIRIHLPIQVSNRKLESLFLDIGFAFSVSCFKLQQSVRIHRDYGELLSSKLLFNTDKVR